MAETDVAMKVWLKDKRRFADFFNGVLFQGEQVVKADELESTDSEADIVITDKNDTKWHGRRNRDVIMRWRKNFNLAILAIENQTRIQHTMPVRIMLYDALAYDEQIKVLCNSRDYKGDYLSAFGKMDSIYPVISIVFYYGQEPWNTNIDLYGMFRDFEDEQLREIMLKYTSNYRINLLDMANFNHIENFKTDLHMVLGMLKYRQNKEELVSYINENSLFFESVEVDTFNAMVAMMKMEQVGEYITDLKKGENVDMCKAINDLWNDAKTEGKAEGCETGKILGREQLSILIRNLIKDGRSDDIERAVSDIDYQNQLLSLYKIS